MKFHAVTDTTTGNVFQALALDIEGAKAQQAAKAASGQVGRRGRVVAGNRYEVCGESFDVEFYEVELQGAQPSRSARQAAARRPIAASVGAGGSRVFPGLRGFEEGEV